MLSDGFGVCAVGRELEGNGLFHRRSPDSINPFPNSCDYLTLLCECRMMLMLLGKELEMEKPRPSMSLLVS